MLCLPAIGFHTIQMDIKVFDQNRTFTFRTTNKINSYSMYIRIE
jgi:hypothetical protein